MAALPERARAADLVCPDSAEPSPADVNPILQALVPYLPRLAKRAFFRTGDRGTAEDLLQDALLKLAQNRTAATILAPEHL